MNDLLETWERSGFRIAWVFTGLTFAASVVIAAAVRQPDTPLWLTLGFASVPSALVYAGMTRKIRRRRRLMRAPFPREWEMVLQRDVVFYRALDPAEKERFRYLLQVFIGEKRITGIKVDLDTTTIVLAAASAIIPIFGFPDWEWHQISEILIYPARFNEGFAFGDSRDHMTLGMVGAGAMNRMMILAKPDLLEGFRNPGDKRNVGIHEFAHLVDKSDGTIDGIPSMGLNRRNIGPWIELVRRKMQEIETGKSDINPYALTNEAEFFAVATEYFFERPGVMKQKHPKLFAALEEIFKQNLGARVQRIRQQIRVGRPSFGRNSPCPCGSGIKFKKCCLR